jgi:hypothetical protein
MQIALQYATMACFFVTTVNILYIYNIFLIAMLPLHIVTVAIQMDYSPYIHFYA